jgi:hypothetical protein
MEVTLKRAEDVGGVGVEERGGEGRGGGKNTRWGISRLTPRVRHVQCGSNMTGTDLFVNSVLSAPVIFELPCILRCCKGGGGVRGRDGPNVFMKTYRGFSERCASQTIKSIKGKVIGIWGTIWQHGVTYRPAILTSPKLHLGSYKWDVGNGATE